MREDIKMMETNGDKISIYTILNRWLYNGSKDSPMPKELIMDKVIGPQYILYYFKDSMYNLYMNKHFNNYDIFQMDRIDILLFLKKCIILTGYRPRYVAKTKSKRSKIADILKRKMPYYKWHDIELLVSLIDKREDKDQIYETLGLYKPRKRKATKGKVIKKTKQEQNIESMDLFSNEVVNPKITDTVTKSEEVKEPSLNLFLKGFTIKK
jgi:hypothetical protein